MPVLETPSRVWRRIQAAEDLAVPSLPSLPAIDDDDLDLDESSNVLIVQPTPSASISGKRSTTVRFAETHESFEFSDIQPITKHDSILTDDDDKLPSDYSISLHSEQKPSPLNTSKNVVGRARTPSLTRSASLASTSPDKTPSSNASLSLPNASRRSSSLLQQSQREPEPSFNKEKDEGIEKSQSSILTKSTQSRPVSETSLRQQSQHGQGSVSQVDIDATPVGRKRSFLIDVIQSAAKPRPRFSLHTPIPSQKVQPAQSSFLTRTPLQLTTPKSGVNDSFISTASSHDLAMHQPNVNASFDHLVGAKGVGRFNATKLNSYLHGLNRRLVEENEELTARLKLQQPSTILEGNESLRALEVDALEAKVKELEAQLEAERREKQQDKDNFKERVQEVERGVNEVVEKLELELETMGKAKDSAVSRARRAEEVKDDAEERALRAELALEKMTKASSGSGRRTSNGSPAASVTATAEHEEFKEAIERVAQLETDLRISMSRCQRLEEELKGADEALEEANIARQVSEKKMDGLKRRSENLIAESEHLQQQIEELEEELKGVQEHADNILSELGAAQEAAASAQAQAESANVDVEALQENVEALEAQIERQNTESQQMEEALEAGEAKMLQDQQELESLRAEVERLRLFASTNRSSARASTMTAVSMHAPPSPDSAAAALDEVQALEKELDEAHREIGRLQHLLTDSPSRNAIVQVKDAKIEKLESENAQLEERIRKLRVLISKGPESGNVSFAGLATPRGRAVSLGILSSPAVHNMPSFRAPKTPGAPLKDLSWLQSTIGDAESPYLRQIALLERELAHANENIDDKLDLLEEYGRGVTGLTEKLAGAENRIGYLNGEIKRLERREDRKTKRLPKQVNCGACGGLVDVSLILADQTELPNVSMTGEASTSDSMRKVLRHLEQMKRDWSLQKNRLENEKQHLQDVADRLNRDAEEAQNFGILSELDQAKQAIMELEEQLKAERSQLKTIGAERTRASHEKNRLASQLERTLADMDSVKDQLQKCKRENYTLEADLRANVVAESQARHLRSKVAENQTLIDQLRRERDNLADSHTALQRQFSQAAERAEDLRKNLSRAQVDHEDRRHQLDLHVAEIEDLKREIALRDEELDYARKKASDKSDLVQIVYELESELARVKMDADAFEQDLRALGDDRKLGRHEDSARTERMQQQLKAEVKILDAQVEEQRLTMRKLHDELENHVCTVSGSETSLTKLKAQHNKECKGLMVQISYLKSKYTRENTFRLELAYQKQYLLVLLARMQPRDTRILAAISRPNFPDHKQSSAPQRKTLRNLVHTVMFANRVKKAAKRWSEQTVAKDQLALALEDVRRRRASGRQSGLVDI